jgi:hypothetical protein
LFFSLALADYVVVVEREIDRERERERKRGRDQWIADPLPLTFSHVQSCPFVKQ